MQNANKLVETCDNLDALVRDINALLRELSDDELRSEEVLRAYVKLRSASEGFGESAQRLGDWRQRALEGAARQRARIFKASVVTRALDTGKSGA